MNCNKIPAAQQEHAIPASQANQASVIQHNQQESGPVVKHNHMAGASQPTATTLNGEDLAIVTREP